MEGIKINYLQHADARINTDSLESVAKFCKYSLHLGPHLIGLTGHTVF